MGTEMPVCRTDENVKADAIAYLTRTGNADILPILGLVADPVAVERALAKAKAGLNSKTVPPRAHDRRAGAGMFCPVCGRRTQADGRCRRQACGGAR